MIESLLPQAGQPSQAANESNNFMRQLLGSETLDGVKSAAVNINNAEISATGDHIDISDYGKSLLSGFKDAPVSDAVKNFINSQFENFEDAVGGSVKAFEASVNITAGQMTLEDGTAVEYFEISVEMFAVSVQTLSDKIETPSQANFLADQLEVTMEFAKQMLESAMTQSEMIKETMNQPLRPMLEQFLIDAEQMIEGVRNQGQALAEAQAAQRA